MYIILLNVHIIEPTHQLEPSAARFRSHFSTKSLKPSAWMKLPPD